jgi:hypothetical protein
MTRTLRILIAVGVWIGSTLACNLPRPTPTPGIEFPTPNLTLTALFSPGGILGTPTPKPVETDSQSGGGGPTAASPTQAPNPTQATNPTVAVIPTNTVPPAQPSPTGVLRPNARFTAAFLDEPPVLDGVWDEWENQGYPARSVVYGNANRESVNDLEGSFRVGWDRNYLYLAVKVIDDKYVQNSSGVQLYQGDSLELQLDTDLQGDLNSTSISLDDYQLGISPGRPNTAGTKEAYLWNPSSVAGTKTNVTIASIGGDGLYRIEVAIPWSLFGVTPEVGKQMGFSLNISDNDSTSENVQQTMISAVAGRTLTDPTTWGILILGD